MKYKYKTIKLNSMKAFKQAERLKTLNWKIISVGFNTIALEKEVKNDNR